MKIITHARNTCVRLAHSHQSVIQCHGDACVFHYSIDKGNKEAVNIFADVVYFLRMKEKQQIFFCVYLLTSVRCQGYTTATIYITFAFRWKILKCWLVPYIYIRNQILVTIVPADVLATNSVWTWLILGLRLANERRLLCNDVSH